MREVLAMKGPLFCQSIALVVILSALTAPAWAAQLQLHLQYDQSYKSDGSPAGYELHDGYYEASFAYLIQPDDIHQFSILLEVIGALESPEESLQGALIDVVLGPGLHPYAPGSYAAATPNPTYDPPGPAPPVGLWTTNEDSGPDDLLRIAVITSNVAAHGLDPGESALIEIGDFFVTYDVYQSPFGTSLFLEPSADTLDPWGLWVGSTGAAQSAADMHRSINPAHPTDAFDILFPEPSSLTLAGLAVLGLMGLVRRRRT
jgi:hypothetical protein